MGVVLRVVATLLKLVLALYLRSAACKLGVPALGCDEPLCALAVDKNSSADCQVTYNTAEQQHWCEYGFTPWMNGLLAAAKIPLTASCTAATGHVLLKVIATMELLGYVLLWVMPQLGSLWLTVFMLFALHFHLKFLQEPVMELIPQCVLLSALPPFRRFEPGGSRLPPHVSSLIVFAYAGESPS